MQDNASDILKEKIKNWIIFWEDKRQDNINKKRKLFAQADALDMLEENYIQIIQDLKSELREIEKLED
jgi:hypothetical protein